MIPLVEINSPIHSAYTTLSVVRAKGGPEFTFKIRADCPEAMALVGAVYSFISFWNP